MIAAALAALALYGAPALAADQIVGASLKPLPLYAQPGGGTPVAKSDGQACRGRYWKAAKSSTG
ncbi:hypothetical protein WJ972_04415 [Achromobacter insuavis]